MVDWVKLKSLEDKKCPAVLKTTGLMAWQAVLLWRGVFSLSSRGVVALLCIMIIQ